jgi:hypothetical protein
LILNDEDCPMNDVPAAPAPRKHTHWLWLLLLLTLVIVGGVAAARLGPQLSPEWEAVSLLRFDPQPFQLLPDGAAPLSADAHLVLRDEFCRTQAALVKSRLVLLEALRNPKVANLALLGDVPEPVEWLDQHLEVSFPDSPHIMQISLHSSKRKDDLVPLVEAIMQAYFKEIVDKDKEVRQKQLAVLKDIADRFALRIKGLRQALRSLQEQVGPGDKNLLARQNERLRIEYNDALKEQRKLHIELRTLQAQLRAYESPNAPEAVVTAAQVNAAIDKDPLMMEYNKRALQLEGLIEGIVMPDDQGEVTDKDLKDLTHYHDLLRQVQKAAEKRRKKLEVSVTVRLREAARAEAREKLAMLKQKVEFLTELEKVTKDEVDKLAKKIETVPVKALNLIDFQRELDEKEETLKAIRKRESALDVELDPAAPPRVSRIGDALRRKKKGK